MSTENKEVAVIEKDAQSLVAKFDINAGINAGAMIPETASAKPLPVKMNVIATSPRV